MKQCHGNYLCIYDVDDIMLNKRIIREYEECKRHPNAIVGCRFKYKLLLIFTIYYIIYRRFPEGSTWHYSDWANHLNEKELYLQQYREVTIIQPTWFMKKEIFDGVGGYIEDVGEDINFFHSHLDLGGELYVIDEMLLLYRYHNESVSKRISRRELLRIRLKALERRVLNKWSSFSIWGAGRDGKNFVNDLSVENQKKVKCFGDVDKKKINKYYVNNYNGLKIPIVHYSKLTSPFICCVALNRTEGEFERNVKSLGYIEGVDYYHFN